MPDKLNIHGILEVDPQSDFSIHNLPFGIYSTPSKSRRAGIAIGDRILDLAVLHELAWLNKIDDPVFHREVLNDFISLGHAKWRYVRERIQHLLLDDVHFFQTHHELFLDRQEAASMHVPVQVGDYTDFYSGLEHAANVGRMFRPNADPLLPNWKHMPVAYHGRSSSIIVSGVPVKRPNGQYLAVEQVVFGPTRMLDFELELGFIVGKANRLGEAVPVQEAESHIFGAVLLNDWSARDIQRWEYQPLGPFLGKNFATAISPWIVTMEALGPFRTPAPEQDVDVLPYLKDDARQSFDIELSVEVQTESGSAVITRNNAQLVYWTLAQQVAHHTVNGCNLRVGDILATGTISGKSPDSWGSMLELTFNGKQSLTIGDTERAFLQDGDSVRISGVCERDGIRIGFGELINKIV